MLLSLLLLHCYDTTLLPSLQNFIHTYTHSYIYIHTGYRVRIPRSQFAISKVFWEFAYEFLQFLCKLRIAKIKYFLNFQSYSLNYYTISYFIPIKYLLFNNNSRKAVDLNNVQLRLISRLDLCAPKSPRL